MSSVVSRSPVIVSSVSTASLPTQAVTVAATVQSSVPTAVQPVLVHELHDSGEDTAQTQQPDEVGDPGTGGTNLQVGVHFTGVVVVATFLMPGDRDLHGERGIKSRISDSDRDRAVNILARGDADDTALVHDDRDVLVVFIAGGGGGVLALIIEIQAGVLPFVGRADRVRGAAEGRGVRTAG